MKFLMLILLFCVQLYSVSPSHKKLMINSGFKQPEATLIMNVVKAVFKKANIPLQMQILPTKRSLINASLGIDDGDATRIWDLHKFFPTLYKVPIQTYQNDVVAITTKRLPLNKFEDLKPYNVGIVRGMKIVEVEMDALKAKSNIKVTSHEKLLQMLVSHRIDVAFADRASLLQEIKKHQIKNLYLYKKPLMILPLYIHLYKTHKHLIPKLTKAAKSLQSKGILKKIKKDFDANLDKSVYNILTVIDNH